MNMSYLLYQGEHIKSATEQREADLAAGQLAASFRRLRRPSARGRASARPAVRIPRQAYPCHDADGHGQCVGATM